MSDVRGARLFVGTNDDPDALLQGNSKFLDGLQGKHGSKQGPLVIGCAPPVKAAVLFYYLEGLGNCPALARRNDVRVAQNVQGMRQSRVEVGRSHVIVIVLRRKAVGLRDFHGLHEGLIRLLAKGLVAGRRRIHGRNAAEGLHILHQLILVVFNPLFHFLIHIKLSFLKPVVTAESLYPIHEKGDRYLIP